MSFLNEKQLKKKQKKLEKKKAKKLLKNEQIKLNKKLAEQAKAEFEAKASLTTKGIAEYESEGECATQGAAEGKIAEGVTAPRADNPNPTDIKPDPKPKKLKDSKDKGEKGASKEKKEVSKKKQEKQEEKLAAQLKAAFEAKESCTTKGASDIQSKGTAQGATKGKTTEGSKGKRAGNPNPNPTDIKPDPKQKKLKDRKVKDVVKASSKDVPVAAANKQMSLQEKKELQREKLVADFEEKTSCNTKGDIEYESEGECATQGATEGKIAEGVKAPHGLVGNPNPTDIKPDPKPKKLKDSKAHGKDKPKKGASKEKEEVSKKKQEKQKEKIIAQLKAAFEAKESCTTKGASEIQSKGTAQGATKGKIAEGSKGKRAGNPNPNPTDIKPDPKQKKLKDRKVRDVAKGSSKDVPVAAANKQMSTQEKKELQREKLVEDFKAAFEEKASCTTEGDIGFESMEDSAKQGSAKGKIAEGLKAPPRGLLGKRAGSPYPKPDPKKKKIENSKNVGKAASSEANEEASKKKKPMGLNKKKSLAVKAPDSPPTTSKGKASAEPTTPERFPSKVKNRICTPYRPKGVSKLIKKDISDEEEGGKPSDWGFDDKESDTDSSTDEKTDSSEKGSEKSSEDSSEDDED